MGIFSGDDLAGEGAIDEGEVTGGEDHADDRPDQADLQAAVGGFRSVDGQRINRITRGKNHREEGNTPSIAGARPMTPPAAF